MKHYIYKIILLFFIILFSFSACERKSKTICVIFEKTGEKVCTHEYKKKENKVHGLTKFYYADGTIALEQDFNIGMPDGPIRCYYPSGKLLTEGNFKADRKSGVWKNYYENGQTQKYSYFLNDSLIYLKNFDKTGEYISSILPIKVKELQTNQKESKELEIELLYSEVDSPYVIALISPTGDKTNLTDTIFQKGKKLNYKWDYYKSNGKSLYGILIEANEQKEDIGEYEFTFPVNTNKKRSM